MADFYSVRKNNVLCKMKEKKVDTLLVADPKGIRYLTGLNNAPYERMYLLVLESDGKMKVFANRLFNLKADIDIDFVLYSDSDNPVEILAKECRLAGSVGIDKIWPACFLLPLMQLKPASSFLLASSCLDECRACKDENEIQKMKEASLINDRVMEKALAFVKGGMSEKELASFIDREFIAEGADGPCFETIVSFAANAADPHHSPDGTELKEGDCILIDMGCSKDGYCSDMTRTVFYKSVPTKLQEIYEIVQRAQETAESFVKAGVRLCDVDAAARNIIGAAGYGKYFTHRLGHFCGQTDHEAGDVSSANTGVCKPGMIFSIEPGIYLPDVGGVRIEDLVMVTDTGCVPLNHVDKNLKVIV